MEQPFFVKLQETEKSKRDREETRARNMRLGKYVPPSNVFPFPERTITTVVNDIPPVQVLEPVTIPPQTKRPDAVVVPINERGEPTIEPFELRCPSVFEIIREVSRFYNLSRLDILSDRRMAATVRGRHIVIYLAKELTLLSFPAIGRTIRRDQATCQHGYHKINRERPKNPALDSELRQLTNILAKVTEKPHV